MVKAIKLNDEIDKSGDIRVARDFVMKIISDQDNIRDNCLNSLIYPNTNEHLYCYRHLFENRKNMLSVIASSEQILSAISAGATEIDAFDISRFPKYYFYLKKAAIQGLTPKEYISFFHAEPEHEILPIKSWLYEDKIRKYMDKEGLVFWDYLFSIFFWKTIKEGLCRENHVAYGMQMENNRYLKKKEYYELRAKLKDAQVNIKTGDIRDLIGSYQNEYDVIYLSNIHSYIRRSEFRNLLCNFKTTPDGVVILGLVEGRMGPHSDDFKFSLVNKQPYKFTRENGYITARKR